jgi:hypothetical protein
MRARAGVVLACLVSGTVPAPSSAQVWDVSGYALGLGASHDASALGPAGTTLLGRLRGMVVMTWGSFAADAAYEHVLTRLPDGGALSLTPGGADVRGGDWLGADWDIRTTDRSTWRHRLDRASVAWETGRTSVTVGRQAISWATTLFLTPADPFAPFDPSDPFREYRAGVDAVRVRFFPGPFAEVEGVVRAAEGPDGTRTSVLARAQTSLDAWAVGAWGGALHGEAAAALFASGAAGATALRGEASLRRGEDGGAVARAAVGVDRRVTAAGRDLFLVGEVQFDGFGAGSPSRLMHVGTSRPYLTGEMQTLGRWTAAAQASWQAHPLVSLDAMVLRSLTDGSALLAPGLSWSATAGASLRLGAYLGFGADAVDPLAGPASEYGAVPLFGYAALSWFF